MENLLYQIYNGDYDVTPKRDKRQQELDKRIYTEWDKVEKMFGENFTDQLFRLEGEREGLLNFLYFQRGFSLGVRLILEAFTPASATE